MKTQMCQTDRESERKRKRGQRLRLVIRRSENGRKRCFLCEGEMEAKRNECKRKRNTQRDKDR